MYEQKKYDRCVIVGVGLIGGSLGLAIRRRYPECKVIGVSSQSTITTALEMGAIDEGYGYEELSGAVKEADCIFLCTPIHRINELITLLAPIVDSGVLITDVGSTKREITSHAVSLLPKEVHFIGGHPMTGSEKRGVTAADPFLFQNAMYVLCPTPGVPKNVIDSFSTFLKGIGAVVLVIDADLHDRITAVVSHLPQVLAVTLVEMTGKLNNDTAPYLRLAAGGFRDMTRIASSPFTMWDDIFRTNSDTIREAVDAFIEHLRNIRKRIGTQALNEDFECANVTRATIPKDTKGFLSTLYELLVVVEDKPGVIAHTSTVLAESHINIKDIEVLKVREGEGGTLRLAFDSERDAQEAMKLLTGIGYKARLRK